ncbi:MAG TPA: hypothetical protein VIX41_06450 [Acidimicrobiales bacterium]
MTNEAEGAAVEGEGTPVDVPDDTDDLDTVEEEDTELPDDLDADDEPEKFAGPEGRDEQNVPD